ncbi:hypothetical protein [Streptomyces sp. CA-111067]|uniref:hypothetical protein n=1 Tax=Streptomyces sp. CA-111067 TaxID=3240046 RepID=UPI003D97BA95
MNRRTVTASVLALAAGLAVQLPAATGASAAGSCAHPKIKVLGTLPGGGGVVNALGRGTIAAGSSAGVPAYWIGDTALKVPFPAGYSYGSVAAINRHDLMVGNVNDNATGRDVAFSYRIGAAKAKFLPGGTYARAVNDSGQIAGGDAYDYPLSGYIWKGGAIQRTLTLPFPSGTSSISTITGMNNQGTVIGAGSELVNGTFAQVGLVWPADPTAPAVALLPIDSTDDSGISVAPQDIDEHGRIVGATESYWADSSYETYWDAPYTADGTRLAGLPGIYNGGYLRAISPTTGLVVGESPESYSDAPGVAEIWTGTGPIRALPGLLPGADTGAEAAADNGNAGGFAVDAGGVEPVIWTCAAQQALP